MGYETMHGQNWDDLRFVLAVADEGSVSAAARVLRVNHATVLRRIAAYEARIGTQIFERTAHGYTVPSDHSRVIDAAREVYAAITAMERVAHGVESKLSGKLRITSTDTFCQTVLPEIAQELRAGGEGLEVEIFNSNAHLDLSRLEADIAIRPAARLTEGLVGERAGELGVAAYGPATGPAHDWLSLCGPLDRSRVSDIMAAAGVVPIATGSDSFQVLREMVASGLGNALLPCVMAEDDLRLQRIERSDLTLSVPIWVASHADIGTTVRLRELRARIVTGLRNRAALLRGPV